MDQSGVKAGGAGVFHWIAPVYGLFFNYQRRYFNAVLNRVQNHLDLSVYKKIVDVGCGTGALCSVLYQRGFIVTGVDSARKMLITATGKKENKSIGFLHADVLKGLPFEEKCFDVSVASFVAHGLKADERKNLYAEMSRITKHLIIIHDFNCNRSFLIDIIERLEGGDYFNFIKNAEDEIKELFFDIQAIEASPKTVCYICRPV
jgi:SAM-dependent methyltransferase